jgi:hypothetical protein
MGKVKGRYLLTRGNDKLGGSIYGWAIPAVQTCPGSSAVCRRSCYCLHGRFVTAKVKNLMKWRLQQSKRADFVDRLVDEIYRRGILVVRVHVSGDLYSPAYTSKWIEIAARSPQTVFLCYTRSWRVDTIEPLLRVFAGLANVKLWYSADAETGYPEHIPPGVRVAWMQTSATEVPQGDLVFQVRKLRQLSLPLALPVCEQETEAGRRKGVNCSSCQFCWR